MGRLLLIIGSILFLFFCCRNSGFRESWNHFWGLTNNYTQEQNQLLYQKLDKTKTVAKDYKNPVDVFEDNQIKYKLQKKPLVDPGSESQFEFILR